MNKTYDVYGLGNALVDMEYTVEDSFLVDNAVAKGHMTLVDDTRMQELIDNLSGPHSKKCSGGSAANTIYAVQGFGGTGFYACRVAGDKTGHFFLNDLNDAGVATKPHDPELPGSSGRCLVLVTQDAERSMNTCLGISDNLDHLVTEEQAIRAANYFYVEGYLSTSEGSCSVAIRSREIAESCGVRTAISLSDPSMVEIFRGNLERMLGNGVDHLFCNEEEALTWTGTDRLDIAITELKDIGKSVNITLGAKGSVAITQDSQDEVSGFNVKAIDTVGAGDIYAGACLYAINQGHSPKAAASFANFSAAQLVAEFGARFHSVAQYQEVLVAFPG